MYILHIKKIVLVIAFVNYFGVIVAMGSRELNRNLLKVAIDGNVAAIQMCIQLGADINTQHNLHNMTPLHYAVGNGHAAAVQALLNANADLTLLATLHNPPETPYEFARPADNGNEVQQVILNHVTAIKPEKVLHIIPALMAFIKPGPQHVPVADLRRLMGRYFVQDVVNAKFEFARRAVPGYSEDELRQRIKANVIAQLKSSSSG